MSAANDLDELNAEWCKAVANQDVEGLVDLYTADAKFLAPGAPLARGREQLSATFHGMFEMGVKSIDLERVELLEGGDLVVEVGTGTMNVQAPDGGDAQVPGKYVAVSRYQPGGTLRIVADIFNLDVETSA